MAPEIHKDRIQVLEMGFVKRFRGKAPVWYIGTKKIVICELSYTDVYETKQYI